VPRTTTKTYQTSGSTAPTTLSQSEQLTGLAAGTASILTSKDANGHTTVATTAIDLASKLVTTTASIPGVSNPAVQVVRNGLLVSAKSPAGSAAATYEYDSFGRQIKFTDPGTSAEMVTVYNSATGQPASVNVSGGQQSSTTSFTYYQDGEAGAGQLKTRTVDGVATTYGYNLRHQTVQVSGDIYPLAYSYDGTYGDLHTLTTAGAAGNAVTTWESDAATGLLRQKKDDNGKGPIYEYTAFGM
jgi:hypothetical protein